MTEQLMEMQKKMERMEQKLNEQSLKSRLLSIASSSAPPAPPPLPTATSLESSSTQDTPSTSAASMSTSGSTQKSQVETPSTKLSSARTNMTEPTPGRPRDVPGAKENDATIILVTDSNGKHLDPELLHDTKKVVIEKRATWEMARDLIPKVPNPAVVTDVVLLPGINNVMTKDQQISDILQIADLTGKKYQGAFPNATIHLGSIAPVNEKCLNYNFHLQELAKHRGAPFITIEDMYDGATGRLRPNVLNGIHYSKVGIRPLAKQIKRNLYRRMVSASNHQSNSQMQPRFKMPHQIARHQVDFKMQPGLEKPHHVAYPSQNAKMILETFFNIAKACLPQQ